MNWEQLVGWLIFASLFAIIGLNVLWQKWRSWRGK